MTKLTRLLKSRDRTSLTGKEQETKCEKCGKRTATGQDGLCDHCRFGGILTGIVESR